MLANPSISTVSRVTASATAVTLAAANSIRVGLIIYNDSTEDLYVKFGSSASSTDFTYFVSPSAAKGVPASFLTASIKTPVSPLACAESSAFPKFVAPVPGILDVIAADHAPD